MNVKRLSDIDVRGKKVFIRADLNVPQDDAGKITEYRVNMKVTFLVK